MDFVRRGLVALLLVPGSFFLSAEKSSYVATDTIQLNDLIVTSLLSKTNAGAMPISVSVISQEKISNRYTPSVLPLLTEEVPGLFVTQRGVMGYGVAGGAAGAMSIRGIGGTPTTGVLVLIDGQPQYMGIMGHPLADSYQSLITERIEVMRGPASTLYGSNAMGGVINIITKKTEDSGIKHTGRAMYGMFNTLSGEYSGSVKNERIQANLSIGYNRSDGHRANMDFRQLNAFGKVGYAMGKHWLSSVDFNVSKTLSSNPGSIHAPLIDNDADILRGSASLHIGNEYAHTSGRWSIYGNFGRHRIYDGYAPGTVPPSYYFHSGDVLCGASAHQSFFILSGNNTTFGIDYRQLGGYAENRLADNRTTRLVDTTFFEFAGYMNTRQAFLNGKLTASTGLRLDVHRTKGAAWIPQVGLNFEPTPNTMLKAIVSKGFRRPTIREMFMFPPQNPDLLPESLINYEVAYSQVLQENRLLLEASFFVIRGENMIQTIPVGGRPKHVNTGRVQNTGCEVQLRFHPNKHWTLSTNYSYLYLKYKITGAPEHKWYVGGSYKNKQWMCSGGVQWIGNLYVLVGENSRTDSFILCNVRTAYQLNSFCSVFLKGENLFNQKYEINAGYPMPGMTIHGGVTINW